MRMMDDPRATKSALGSGFSGFSAGIKHEARFGLLRCLGLATLLSWIFGLYWSNIFVSYLDFQNLDYLSIRSIWLGAESLALLLLLLRLRSDPKLLSQRRPQAILGSVAAVGTALVICSLVWHLDVSFCIIGAAVTGLGSATLMVAWSSTLAKQGSQGMLLDIGISFLLACGFDLALMLMPVVVSSVATIALPIACGVLLYPAHLRARREPQAPFVLEAAQFDQKATSTLWRLLVLPLLVGLSYGLMQRLTYSEGAVYGSDYLTILTFLITGVLSIATSVFFVQDRLLKFTYFLALPIMATAFALLPFSDSHTPTIQAIYMVGFNYFYFIIWVFWSGRWKASKLSIEQRFAVGLLVLMASESAGSLLGIALKGVVSISSYTIALISMAVVYALMMGALLSIGSFLRPSSSPKGVLSGSGKLSADPDDAFLFPLALIGRYGLSPRECDVLNLLVRGRTRAYISKMLYISDNTTRTHMRNIYRKLDVHSHQELLDLIEEGGRDDESHEKR